MVTMDEVLYDLFLRNFATDTSLYGRLGSFDAAGPHRFPQRSAAPAVARRRQARLEHRVPAPVLSRHLADPVPAGPVPLPVRCPRPVELSARPGAARPVRSQQAVGRTRQPGGTPDRSEAGARVRRRRSRASWSSPILRASRRPARGCGAGRLRTGDPYRPLRLYLFELLRLPGEENEFKIEDRVSSRRAQSAADAAACAATIR